MNDLKQILTITHPQGNVAGLMGLKENGAVYYGALTPMGRDTYKIVWTQVEETER